jgi:hypothetical protein
VSITIGWIDSGETRGEFTESITKAAAYEALKGRLVSVIRVQSGPLMAEGRNKLVELFQQTGAEWLFMVDTDMQFTHDSIERLLHTALSYEARVVGGLCYGVNKELGQFPTLYRRLDGMPAAMLDFDAGQVLRVDATGAAFTLTHASIFNAYRRDEYHPWFHHRFVPSNGKHPGGWLGEDISWHWWLTDKGVPILVDTTVEAGHIKPVVVGTDTYQVPT